MRNSSSPFLVLAALGLFGCATAPQTIYTSADGSRITTKQDVQAFDTNRSICLGEMGKAKLGGTVVPTGNVFMDASNDVQRSQDANQVMLGCMAGHGYKLTQVSSAN